MVTSSLYLPTLPQNPKYSPDIYIYIHYIIILSESRVTRGILSTMYRVHRQSSQLSCIVCETHAFYAKLMLTRFVSSFSCINDLDVEVGVYVRACLDFTMNL